MHPFVSPYLYVYSVMPRRAGSSAISATSGRVGPGAELGGSAGPSCLGGSAGLVARLAWV
jgi:hypothetical protein